jgi:disulfide bond formation protein DsbB
VLSAFYIQFVMHEFPCPLCMLQRYAMFLSSLGALFVIMQARRGELTTARYGQGRVGLGAPDQVSHQAG